MQKLHCLTKILDIKNDYGLCLNIFFLHCLLILSTNLQDSGYCLVRIGQIFSDLTLLLSLLIWYILYIFYLLIVFEYNFWLEFQVHVLVILLDLHMHYISLINFVFVII